MKTYKGIWTFAPMSTPTTHTVKAKTEDEAVELLSAWALAHKGCVDNPFDFDIEA